MKLNVIIESAETSVTPVMELSSDSMKSYRKLAIADAMKKHHAGGASNEIEAVKRAKSIARSVRLELGRRNQIREAVMDMPVDAAKARLASLRDFIANVPRNLTSQDQYDEVEDAQDEIKELEAYLNQGVNEAAATSADAYAARTQQCKELLAKINQYLDTHAQKQQANPESWGFAGDLAHVATQLEEIWEFLSSEEDCEQSQMVEGFNDDNGEFSRSFIQGVMNGSIDLYDELNANTSDGRALSRLVDIIAAQHKMNPDGDMEEILDLAADHIMNLAGQDPSTPFARKCEQYINRNYYVFDDKISGDDRIQYVIEETKAKYEIRVQGDSVEVYPDTGTGATRQRAREIKAELLSLK